MKESVFRLVYICVLMKDTSEKKDNFHDPCISFLLRFHCIHVVYYTYINTPSLSFYSFKL